MKCNRIHGKSLQGVCLVIALLFPLTLLAQAAWPTRPVTIVVGYPPGGSGDFTTRVVAEEMSRNLGIAVLAENRPGAGATIASDVVAKAANDGYTLLNATHHAINKALYKKLPYDPDHDFIGVTRVATGPMVIVVNNHFIIRK